MVSEKPKDPQSKVGASRTSPLPSQAVPAKDTSVQVPKATTTKRPANRNADKASKPLSTSEAKPKPSNAEGSKPTSTRNAILLNPTIKFDINAPDPFNAKNEIKRTFYNDKNGPTEQPDQPQFGVIRNSRGGGSMLSVHQVGSLSGKAMSKSSSQQHIELLGPYNSAATRNLGGYNALDVSKPGPEPAKRSNQGEGVHLNERLEKKQRHFAVSKVHQEINQEYFGGGMVRMDLED